MQESSGRQMNQFEDSDWKWKSSSGHKTNQTHSNYGYDHNFNYLQDLVGFSQDEGK